MWAFGFSYQKLPNSKSVTIIVLSMAKPRVLIIDTDAQLVQSLREQLLNFGFEVNAQAEFKDTRFLKDVNNPHLILMDVLAPGTNGFEAIRAIRKESMTPVIVTTSKSEIADKVVGLESGADDYITKPFESRELIARINSVLRRSPPREHFVADFEAREWRFKGLIVQSNRRRIILDGEPVELTTAEFDLLRLFVSNAQHALSRELILDQLRGIEWEAVDRSVDILISRLRDKLKDDPRRPRFIRTVRSVGYQFVGEPDTEEGDSGEANKPQRSPRE